MSKFAAAHSNAEHRDDLQRRTLLVLVVSQVIGTVGVGVAPSIGVLLAGQVTDDEALAGLARTASTLGAALLGLPLGALATAWGRRAALSTGWWVAAVGAALLVAAAQWSLVAPMFVGLLLIGAGSAASLQSRFAATDLARPERRARSLSLIVWVGTIGSVLGPNLGVPAEALEAATGLTVFAGAFAIAAVCLAVAGVVVAVLLRPDPLLAVSDGRRLAMSARTTVRAKVAQTLGELRSNRRARTAVLAVLTAQVVMVGVMTMTPVHVAHHGGSIAVIGMTISLHIGGMYALAPVVGAVTDRFGHRPAILVGIAILVASLSIGALRPDNMGLVAVSLVLLGIGWSFVNVAGSALFAGSVREEGRASAQGGLDALSNLSGAAAALGAGPLLSGMGFAWLCVVAAVALVPLLVALARAPLTPASASEARATRGAHP